MRVREQRRRREAIRALAAQDRRRGARRLAQIAARAGFFLGREFSTDEAREAEVNAALTEERTLDLLPRDEVRR